MVVSRTTKAIKRVFGIDSPAGKAETFVVDTSNILFICSGAFVGLENLVNSRIGKGVSLRFIGA